MNRWLILFLGVIANLAQGVAYASSVLRRPMMEDMLGIDPAESQAYFSIIFTLTVLFLPVGMLIAGRLERITHRLPIALGATIYGFGLFLSSFVTDFYVLCFTFGLTLSIGSGLVYGTVIANAVRWFPDKKGLASGFVVGGLGFGPVWVAPLCAFLLYEQFAIQQVLQILGTICFVAMILVAITPAPPQQQVTPTTPTGTSLVWSQMLCTGKFWLLFTLFFLGTLPGMMIISGASGIFQSVGDFTPERAAGLVAILAMANALGRFSWGAISDYIGRINTLAAMYIFSASAMIALTFPAASNPALLVVIVIVIGMTFGGYPGLFPSFCAEAFGLKNMAMNYAFLFSALSIAGLVGPRIFVSFEEPLSAFYVAVGAALTGCAIALVYRQVCRR